ncbi:MAG: response regulator [Acidobacteriota bacterium]
MSAVSPELQTVLQEARILLADDNPISQNTTRFMLNYLGAEVDIAEHGRAALELVSQKPYDLILMDCQMPVMNGYEATRAIREHEERATEQSPTSQWTRTPRVPIVALSGRVMEGDREECLDHGMDDCLGKPFDLANLRSCLERWLSASE